MATESARPRLAVLAFHKVGEPPAGCKPSRWYLSEASFIHCLQYLSDNRWQVIDAGEFVRSIGDHKKLPARTALLTFDDGYRKTLEVAMPLLARFGYPSVMFVPTKFIAGRNAFDAGHEPEEAICDWCDLRELEKFRCSIQSHGVSHTPLSWLDSPHLEHELVASKAILEAGLGKSVEVFAYPHGDDGCDSDATAAALKRAGYKAACLYGGGPNHLPIPNPYRWERIPVERDTSLTSVLAETCPAAGGRTEGSAPSSAGFACLSASVGARTTSREANSRPATRGRSLPRT